MYSVFVMSSKESHYLEALGCFRLLDCLITLGNKVIAKLTTQLN